MGMEGIVVDLGQRAGRSQQLNLTRRQRRATRRATGSGRGHAGSAGQCITPGLRRRAHRRAATRARCKCYAVPLDWALPLALGSFYDTIMKPALEAFGLPASRPATAAHPGYQRSSAARFATYFRRAAAFGGNTFHAGKPVARAQHLHADARHLRRIHSRGRRRRTQRPAQAPRPGETTGVRIAQCRQFPWEEGELGGRSLRRYPRRSNPKSLGDGMGLARHSAALAVNPCSTDLGSLPSGIECGLIFLLRNTLKVDVSPGEML